jgi:hypothetical protein
MTQLSTTLDKVLNQYMLKVKVQLMNLLMLVGGTQMVVGVGWDGMGWGGGGGGHYQALQRRRRGRVLTYSRYLKKPKKKSIS